MRGVWITRPSSFALAIGCVVALGAASCSKRSPTTGDAATDAAPATQAALRYPVGINAVSGFEEIVPAGKPLPALFSDRFATSVDDQPTVQLAIGQKRPAGVEKICDFTIEQIPPGPKTTQSVIVTVEVSEAKMLSVKVRTQSTGALQTFGPFPVE